jgi:hypothetical protein
LNLSNQILEIALGYEAALDERNNFVI